MFALGFSRQHVGGNIVVEYHLVHCDGSTVTPVATALRTSDTLVPIRDLWGSSGDNVFTVGDNGTIQHYDGSSWQPMASGSTEDIFAIWGLPTGEIFAVTQHAVLCYDGASWRHIFITDEDLNDIWATSHDDVFVVGRGGAVLHYDGHAWVLTRLPYGLNQIFGSASNDVYTAGDTNSRIYHFDGITWQPALLPTFSFVTTSIWGTSPADMFAVGYGDEEGPDPSVFHFDGTEWHRESIPFLIPFNRDLTMISGNEQSLFVGGDYSDFLRFDGEAWRGGSTSDGDYVSDISAGPGNSLVVSTSGGCVSSFDGASWTRHYCGGDVTYAWASALDDIFKVAGSNIAHFDGRSWQSMPSNTTVDLNDVWGRSALEVYAVGDSGTVVHYDGQSCQPMQSNTTERLLGIWGNAEIAVVVGAHGIILHLQDGQWLPVNSPTTKKLTGVWGAASNEIYAVGPRVVLHYDGSRWEILSDTIGGKQVWVRPGDGLYMLAADTLGGDEDYVHVYSSRILRYGPPANQP
jgi:photosystem II stability/assembly factor-like uncharacterized protein